MSRTLQRSRTRSGAAYVTAGEGEPLVLLHGVGMRLEAWRPQIEFFSSSHHVVAVDLPGHGQSDRLPEGSALPAFVSWLEAVIDDLGLQTVNLAGHSMGGMISGGVVATLPDRVMRVALLNAVHRRSPEASAAVIARAEELNESSEIDFETPLRRWFGEDKGLEAVRELIRHWLQTVDPAGYSTAYGAFARGDGYYADCWNKVACPALFVTGSGDSNSTPAMSHAMASDAPHGRAVIVDGHRHMVNLTSHQIVNDALARWLAEPTDPGAKSARRHGA